MNEIMIKRAEKELTELLKKQPHLIELQFEISKNLAKLDNSEDRMYYLSIELLDSFYKLQEKLEEADKKAVEEAIAEARTKLESQDPAELVVDGLQVAVIAVPQIR